MSELCDPTFYGRTLVLSKKGTGKRVWQYICQPSWLCFSWTSQDTSSMDNPHLHRNDALTFFRITKHWTIINVGDVSEPKFCTASGDRRAKAVFRFVQDDSDDCFVNGSTQSHLFPGSQPFSMAVTYRNLSFVQSLSAQSTFRLLPIRLIPLLLQ